MPTLFLGVVRLLVILFAFSFVGQPVSAGSAVQVMTPNGGQKWRTGGAYQIRWRKGEAGAKVRILLLKNGKAYQWIAKTTEDDGKYTWIIPASVGTADTYQVKVASLDYSPKNRKAADSSDRNFTIANIGGGDSLRLTAPNAGLRWSTGRTYLIRWKKGDAGAKVRILLLKNGKAYQWIAKTTENDGKYAWIIPTSVGTADTYRIKVVSHKDRKVADSSDRNFTITNTGGEVEPQKSLTPRVEPTVSLSCSPEAASEAGGEFTCTAKLSRVSTKKVEIQIQYSGTSTPGIDWNMPDQALESPIEDVTLNFAAGKSAVSWTFFGVPDDEAEGNETIIIDIKSKTNDIEDGAQQAILTLVAEDED